MKLGFLIMAIIASSAVSQAYVLHCGSSDASLMYSFDQTDGGAPRMPLELLKVNGKEIINVSTPGGPEYRNGRIALTQIPQHKTIVPASGSAQYRTSWFDAVANVYSLTGSLILSASVRCTEKVYVGPPRP